MSYGTSQVMEILDRFFELANDPPIRNALANAGRTGGGRPSSDPPAHWLFMISVKSAILKLTRDEWKSVSTYRSTRAALLAAELAGMGDPSAPTWTRYRRREWWRQLARDHRRTLDRIRKRDTFKSGVARLGDELARTIRG